MYINHNLYRPKRSFGQGNIFTPVCHSVHRGGGCSRYCSNLGGCSRICYNFPGGGIFVGGGSSKFWGGFFWGGSSKFLGGGYFLGGPPNFGGYFFGGGYFLGGGGFLQIYFWGGGGSPPEYGQRSAGTHPTGMHSCYTCF